MLYTTRRHQHALHRQYKVLYGVEVATCYKVALDAALTVHKRLMSRCVVGLAWNLQYRTKDTVGDQQRGARLAVWSL